MWANRNGRMIRVFCGCGQWTDIRVHPDGRQEIARVVKTPTGVPMVEVE
jgi:hypothetical protein